MNYQDDLEKCKQLYSRPVMFAMFARDKKPEYIERGIELEGVLNDISKQIQGVVRGGKP
jgi:hypothetical protein